MEETTIPEEFHSEYEERPFKTCTRCGETLQDFEESYQIAKIYKGSEVVFEYALCSPCQAAMMEAFSEQSKQSIHQYQTQHFNFNAERDECAFCNDHFSAFKEKEYSLGAMCLGNSLKSAFTVCGECMEEMNALLSEETHGIWGRFIEENFPGIPSNFQPDPVQIPVF